MRSPEHLSAGFHAQPALAVVAGLARLERGAVRVGVGADALEVAAAQGLSQLHGGAATLCRGEALQDLPEPFVEPRQIIVGHQAVGSRARSGRHRSRTPP
jgi:hypothetical protein